MKGSLAIAVLAFGGTLFAAPATALPVGGLPQVAGEIQYVQFFFLGLQRLPACLQ